MRPLISKKTLKAFLAISALSSMNPIAIQGVAAPKDGSSNVQSKNEAVRISMETKGFSIVPPAGWQIEKETPGVSLLMRAEKESFPGYFPTLQVTIVDEPRFIDELGVADFTSKMSTKIANTSKEIKDFRFLDHSIIALADGRPAILFYAEFKLLDKNFMQAMLLASSETRHYTLTFTDSSENFDGQSKEIFFNNAWTSMISLTLDTPTPTRTQFFWKYAIPFGILLALYFLARMAYRIRSGRKYGKMLLEMDVFSNDTAHDFKSETPLSRKISRHKQRMESQHHRSEMSSHSQVISPPETSQMESIPYPESIYASLLETSEHDESSFSEVKSDHSEHDEDRSERFSEYDPPQSEQDNFRSDHSKSSFEEDEKDHSIYENTKKAG